MGSYLVQGIDDYHQIPVSLSNGFALAAGLATKKATKVKVLLSIKQYAYNQYLAQALGEDISHKLVKGRDGVLIHGVEFSSTANDRVKSAGDVAHQVVLLIWPTLIDIERIAKLVNGLNEIVVVEHYAFGGELARWQKEYKAKIIRP